MLIQQSFNLSSFSLIFPFPILKKVAVTGELSLDGTLLPVEKADIKYQMVTQEWVIKEIRDNHGSDRHLNIRSAPAS